MKLAPGGADSGTNKIRERCQIREHPLRKGGSHREVTYETVRRAEDGGQKKHRETISLNQLLINFGSCGFLSTPGCIWPPRIRTTLYEVSL